MVLVNHQEKAMQEKEKAPRLLSLLFHLFLLWQEKATKVLAMAARQEKATAPPQEKEKAARLLSHLFLLFPLWQEKVMAARQGKAMVARQGKAMAALQDPRQEMEKALASRLLCHLFQALSARQHQEVLANHHSGSCRRNHPHVFSSFRTSLSSDTWC